jgi:hypothetical protein
MDDDLPREPDLDYLPAELREHPGSFFVEAVDEDGSVYPIKVTREHVSTRFADVVGFAG